MTTNPTITRKTKIKEFRESEISKWTSHFENLMATEGSSFLPEEILAHLESSRGANTTTKDIHISQSVSFPSTSSSAAVNQEEQHGIRAVNFRNPQSVIGFGAYSTVFKLKSQSGLRIACKRITKGCSLNSRKSQAERIATEIFCLEALSNEKSVVDFLAFKEEDKFVDILMLYCEGGDLFSRLDKVIKFHESEAAGICFQIASFLVKAHSFGIMHRDLKPENILLRSNTSMMDICVADFGLATLFSPGDRFTEVVGTYPYMSPNMIRGDYGPETDLWSLGAILYHLLSGKMLFHGKSDAEIVDELLNFETPVQLDSAWSDISQEARNLVQHLLEIDEKKRLTAREVLDHPWIRRHNK